MHEIKNLADFLCSYFNSIHTKSIRGEMQHHVIMKNMFGGFPIISVMSSLKLFHPVKELDRIDLI